MNRITRGVAAVLMACGTMGAVYAAATPVEEAQSLMNQGQYDEALRSLDSYLSRSPQDAQARFTRGLILVKLNRTQEAIKAFSDLTRDYPQLPEPYNNLAVLYAQSGEYEKARDALEAALASHPNYATAHENLGDIYAALAGAAYQRALVLERENPGIRAKLALINQINGPGMTGASAAAAAGPARPARTSPVLSAPPGAAPPASSAAAAQASDGAGDNIGKAAIAAVYAWAKAWSEQDADSYVAAYDDNYHPPGMSHHGWVASRRARVTAAKSIRVEIQNPQAKVLGPSKVAVSFHEIYKASNHSDESDKVLELSQSGGAWKIVREAAQ